MSIFSARSIYGAASTALAFAAWGVFSVFFGLVAVFLPGYLAIGLIVIPTAAAAVFLRPEYGIVFVAGLACGLIPPSMLPSAFGFGVGELIIVVIFISVLIGRQGVVSKRVMVSCNPVTWGVFAVLTIWFCISVAYSIAIAGIPVQAALGEARDLGYLVLFPLTILVGQDPVRRRRILFGLVVLAFLFSCGQLLQGVFNVPVFGHAGRLEVLETLGQKSYGVTRSLTRGISIILFALFLFSAGYVAKRMSVLRFFVSAAILSAGVLLTFGRTTFAVAILGLLFVTWVLDKKALPRFLLFMFIGATVAMAGLAAIRPAIIEGLLDRVGNTSNEIEYGASAQWRFLEAELVLPQIESKPILGLGLGAEYRKNYASDVVPEQNRYIHNGYLYVAAKMGIPAVLLLVCFVVGILVHSTRIVRDPLYGSEEKVICAAGGAMMLRFLFASITEPHFMADYGISVICIVAGIIVGARRTESAQVCGRTR